MKKKVLIIVTLAEVGGAQMSVLNLSRELSKRGFDITVGFGEGDFLSEECQRYSIPTKRFSGLKRSFGILDNLRFIFEMRKYLKENRFDVLHVNSSNALLASLSAFSLFKERPRVVFTYRGLSFLEEKNELSFLKRIIFKLIFRFLILFVDREVFVSKSNFESAKRMGLGRKGVVIYNGLPLADISFYEKEKAREILGSLSGRDLSGKRIIGSIGRLAYQKNYEFLIRNIKRIEDSDTVCLVIGEGPERSYLEGLIKEEGVEESFFLAGEYKGASKLLSGFDVFVLPSRYEGLSITTLEALFSGVPMLLTSTGGNPEVINGHSSFLFEVDDDEEFKEKLTSLLTEEGWYEEALDLSRERSYLFGISQTANGYEGIYKN